MEFSIFQLQLRGLILGIGLLIYLLYCIKKRKFLVSLFFEKQAVQRQYTGRNDIRFLKFINLILLIMAIFILIYLLQIALDIPHILNKEYDRIQGYTVEQSHGGANVSYEKRSVRIKDQSTGKIVEVIVFSEYIDANEFLEVQFLPNTKYGAIVSKDNTE